MLSRVWSKFLAHLWTSLHTINCYSSKNNGVRRVGVRGSGALCIVSQFQWAITPHQRATQQKMKSTDLHIFTEIKLCLISPKVYTFRHPSTACCYRPSTCSLWDAMFQLKQLTIFTSLWKLLQTSSIQATKQKTISTRSCTHIMHTKPSSPPLHT